MRVPDEENLLYGRIFELRDSDSLSHVAAWLGFTTLREFRPGAFLRIFDDDIDFEQVDALEISNLRKQGSFPFAIHEDGLEHVGRALLFQGFRADMDVGGAHEMINGHAECLREFDIPDGDIERVLVRLNALVTELRERAP